jgi:hypothetical protein
MAADKGSGEKKEAIVHLMRTRNSSSRLMKSWTTRGCGVGGGRDGGDHDDGEESCGRGDKNQRRRGGRNGPDFFPVRQLMRL